MLIVPVQLNLTVEMQLVLLSLLIVLTEDNMGVGLYLVYLMCDVRRVMFDVCCVMCVV